MNLRLNRPAVGVMLVVAASAIAAEKPVIYYTAPQDKDAAPSKYSFNRWNPGDTACVANDDVNLRAAADPQSKSVSVLGLGMKVSVKRLATDAVKVSDRVDLWYEVEATDAQGAKVTGFVFGGALSPLCFEADLDGDGEKEKIAVSMGWDFKIRVRVVKPSLTGAARMATFDLRPAGEGYLSQRGGRAQASVLGVEDAGMALIRIDSQPEACSDYWRAYLSYGKAGAKPNALARLQKALEVGGLADPPNMSTFTVHFDPAKKTATVTRTNTDTDDEAAKPEVTKETFQLADGVYVNTTKTK